MHESKLHMMYTTHLCIQNESFKHKKFSSTKTAINEKTFIFQSFTPKLDPNKELDVSFKTTNTFFPQFFYFIPEKSTVYP